MAIRHAGLGQSDSNAPTATGTPVTSLAAMARHSIQLLDRSRPRREGNRRSPFSPSVPAALSDCSTSPRSSQDYLSESEVASSAPSSPHPPQQRKTDPVNRNVLSLPIRTSRPPLAMRAASDFYLPPIHGGSQGSQLPGVGELLRFSRPGPSLLLPPAVTQSPYENERKMSTVSEPITETEYVWSRQSSPGPDALAPIRRRSNDLGSTHISSWLSTHPEHAPMEDEDWMPSRRARYYAEPRTQWDRAANPRSLIPRSLIPRFYSDYNRRLPYRPHDPMGTGARLASKKKNESHCNKPYTTEQAHYVRYHLMDLGIPWKELQAIYDDKFPDDQWERTEQGIQGKYYRSNQELPCVDHTTDTYLGLPNGHLKPKCVKSREQNGERHAYTLLYLYPEAAVTYDWLPATVKAEVMARAETRRRSRENIKQAAIDRGTYEAISKVPCACCVSSQKRKQKVKQRQNRLHGAMSAATPSPPRHLSASPTVKTEPVYADVVPTIKTEPVDGVESVAIDMKIAWT